jgi:hypothetical protein
MWRKKRKQVKYTKVGVTVHQEDDAAWRRYEEYELPPVHPGAR